jgi:hypothetical protein
MFHTGPQSTAGRATPLLGRGREVFAEKGEQP